jgi:hypothetical protein
MHLRAGTGSTRGMGSAGGNSRHRDDRQAINGGQIGVDAVRERFDALIAELLRRCA